MDLLFGRDPRRRLIIIMREIAQSQPPLRREFFASKAAADNLPRALFGEKAFGKSQIFRLGGRLYLCTFAFFAPIAAHSLQERGQRGHISACGAHDLLRVAAHHFQQIFRLHSPSLSQSPHCAANRVRRAATHFYSPLFKPEISSLSRARWTSFKSGAAEE